MATTSLSSLTGVYSVAEEAPRGDLTALIAQVKGQPNYPYTTTLVVPKLQIVETTEAPVAGGTLAAKRFVDQTLAVAGIDSLTVIGVSPSGAASGAQSEIDCSGIHVVTADCPLIQGDPIKVGVAGRASKYTSAQTTITAVAAGMATSFTQPGGAVTLDVAQATDVAADRGRVLTIVGSLAGTGKTEDVTLNSANSSTTVVTVGTFDRVSAAYFANGVNLGAQAVTVKQHAGATICTIAGGAYSLGAVIPDTSLEAYNQAVIVTGPNTDATFISLIGYDTTDALKVERLQLDAASPAKKLSTTLWRTISRVCVGEFTNAAASNAKTDPTTDTAGMKCGVCVTAAASRGADALCLIKPNA